jgi:opacity protein-like surface antigen
MAGKGLMRLQAIVMAVVLALAAIAGAQDAKAQQPKADAPQAAASTPGQEYSGMYTFLKDGEFVQLTVEDGQVSGFVSRYGDGDDFVDQLFKTAKLDGKNLTFTTQVVKGTSFDFKGTVERGEGKNPGDDAYYVLKGKLTETTTGADKKTSSQSQDVLLKEFSPVTPAGK